MKEQQTRSKISNEFKWDLTPIYKNDKEWENDLEKAKKEIKKISKFTDLLSSSRRLLEYIK